MSTTNTTGVTRINREEARVLAAAEFERFAALTASLIPKEWATDTDCVGWDVRKMVLHVLGSVDAQASPLVFLRQLRRGLPLNKEIDSHLQHQFRCPAGPPRAAAALQRRSDQPTSSA